MKIVHVITGLDVGGAENALCDLALAHVRAGIEVHVISLKTPGPVGDQLRAAGISVQSVGLASGSLNPLALIRLAAGLWHQRADLVQTWMYHANLLGGLASRLTARVPVVWNLRHVLTADAVDLRPRTRQIATIGARLSSILPDRIICCGQAVMNSHADRGYAAQRMVVIPNGVDVTRFRPDTSARRSARAELGLSDQQLLIGMFARYHPVKDHAAFIRAAAILHERIPQAQFVLCGHDVDQENTELSAQLEAKGLTPLIHLLGERNDLPRLYAGLDLAVLTSRSEAFPLVLCEAMACGIPVVATDVGDCAEIIGDTGRVVPAGDAHAMSAAWLDILRMGPSEHSSLGARARLRICSEFDLEITARRYLDLYDQLTNKSSKE